MGIVEYKGVMLAECLFYFALRRVYHPRNRCLYGGASEAHTWGLSEIFKPGGTCEASLLLFNSRIQGDVMTSWLESRRLRDRRSLHHCRVSPLRVGVVILSGCRL